LHQQYPFCIPLELQAGPFLKKVLRNIDNTPPMPLLEAHLGGFLF
jgi:hypothetical protein